MAGSPLKISAEKLKADSIITGFRPDMLEKAARLLDLLDAVFSHPYLKDRLVLKGGTALNLFIFDIPRLSVDIDLNYIGSGESTEMLQERPLVERAIQAVLAREGYSFRGAPAEHAGGKWYLTYPDAAGQYGNLDVDINFMFRTPLWPATVCDSRQLGSWRASKIPLLDLHELVAGKLAALLSRRQARDLFDSNRALKLAELDRKRLRTAFVVYGAMNRRDWRTIETDGLTFDTDEMERQLMPTLRVNESGERSASEPMARRMALECRDMLSMVLPFSKHEMTFLDKLLDKGEIDSTLLTDDTSLQERIRIQPMLAWKTINVRAHKGLP
jgi:predicted nucleotidyltransferase component of viral defense system